jgi:hypothetical protein
VALQTLVTADELALLRRELSLRGWPRHTRWTLRGLYNDHDEQDAMHHPYYLYAYRDVLERVLQSHGDASFTVQDVYDAAHVISPSRRS